MAVRHWSVFLILFALSSSLVGQQQAKSSTTQAPASVAQDTDSDAADRRAAALAKRERADAIEYANQHRYEEALPLLQKYAAVDPKDKDVIQALAITMINTAYMPKDPAERKQKRAKARQMLVRAKQLGVDSDLVDYYLSAIPESGGSDSVFSDRKEVQDAMQQGEMAFANKQYDDAIKAYTRAMLLDPNLYMAVLFVGDSYFAQGKYGSAMEWFERATKIDPNSETAYRYWGDALSRLRRNEEARSRYIEGIVADPYQVRSWGGLKEWANLQQLQFKVVVIKSPNSVKLDGDKTNVSIDPASLSKNDGSSAWMLYDLSKALWMREKFFKEFPNEKKYRHSLKEESDLLHMVAASVRNSRRRTTSLSLIPPWRRL